MQAIGLITDLGSSDHYVSLLKATILDISTDFCFVDVSHNIEPHDIREAAYFLKSVFSKFPKNTIYISSVYNYYNSAPEFILFEYEERYFIGPNNGLFSLVFENLKEDEIQLLNYSDIGSDPFAAYAKGVALVLNGWDKTQISRKLEMFNRKLDVQPVVNQKEIRATIIYVDHFENVVLNVSKTFFEEQKKNRGFKLFFKHNDPITKICNNYGEVDVGDVVAFFNCTGYLEIAINMGKASSMLDLYKNETVQIYFE